MKNIIFLKEELYKDEIDGCGALSIKNQQNFYRKYSNIFYILHTYVYIYTCELLLLQKPFTRNTTE